MIGSMGVGSLRIQCFLLWKCHTLWLPGPSGEPSLPNRFLFIHTTVNICSGCALTVTLDFYCSAKQISLILIFIFNLSVLELKDDLWDSRRFVCTLPVFSTFQVILSERTGVCIFWNMLQWFEMKGLGITVSSFSYCALPIYAHLKLETKPRV